MTYNEWVNQYYFYISNEVMTIVDYGIYELYYGSDLTHVSNTGGGMQGSDMDRMLHPEMLLFFSIITYTDAFINDMMVSNIKDTIEAEEDPEKLQSLIEELDNVQGKEEYPCLKRCLRYYESGKLERLVNLWLKEVMHKRARKNDHFGRFIKFIDDELKIELFRKATECIQSPSDKEFAKALDGFLKSVTPGSKRGLDEIIRFGLDWEKEKEKEKEEKDLKSKISPEGILMDLSSKYEYLRNELSKRIIGQDPAIQKFLRGLFNSELRKEERKNGPEASFLFVGPPGVGKTYLAKNAAKLLDRPCKLLQMNQYAQHESFINLIGSDQVYRKGHTGELTQFVLDNPNAVIIVDEIEKAHINTLHQFLSVLDGGFLQDICLEKQVDFTGTVFIFTTNAGRSFYEDNRERRISAIPETTMIDALRGEQAGGSESMPTELLSRLAKGSIIGFDHMEPAKLLPLIRKGMERAAEIVKKRLDITCSYDSVVLPYLFLYHMGSQLDARVAAARSETMIKDCVFRLVEQLGEEIGSKEKKKLADKPVFLNIKTAEEDLAEELIKPAKETAVIIVCNTNDRYLFKPVRGIYKVDFAYAEKSVENGEEFIRKTLREKEVTAILVDPFMRIDKKQGRSGQGVGDLDSNGSRILHWLFEQRDMPPVYAMELGDARIGVLDREQLEGKGLTGVISLQNCKEKDCRDMITDLVHERFLSGTLSRLSSRGRALAFEMGHTIEAEKDAVNITVLLKDMRLISNMGTDAQDVFLSDSGQSDEDMDDVIGGQQAKEELMHFVKYIKDPQEFKRSGQMISRGILMYGPPGSGKTKLARALAAEADCPFISVKGTQFIRGEKKVAEIFRLARKYAPSIVFIDEIDAFGGDRDRGNAFASILIELMTEMDGFDKQPGDKPVFVIAATNAASEPDLGEQNIYLDPALLRRFTKKVYMRWPNKAERLEFLKLQKQRMKDFTVNMNRLSEKALNEFAIQTAGHSIAEIENALTIAIGRAAEKETNLTLEMLKGCFDEMIYGEVKKVSKDHLRMTALHEAGHAYVSFISGERFTPESATIIARGGFLGMVKQIEDEEAKGYMREELLARIRILLAGRAAEMEFSASPQDGLTTGASNDLERATMLAEALITRYGMEEGFLPVLSMEMMLRSPLAEKYHTRLNEILTEQLEKTREIIRSDRKKVENLANALLDRSMLNTEEMKAIIDMS